MFLFDGMAATSFRILSRWTVLATLLISTLPAGIRGDEEQRQQGQQEQVLSEAVHGPWANRLKCHGVSPTSKKPFCLYMSSTFNHGGGISLIMTQKTTLSFADVIQSHDPTGKTKPHLKADDEPSPDLFYEIVNQPFKGNVLLAQKDIHPSKTVVSSRPALIIDDEYMQLTETDTEAKMLFTDAVNGLPDEYMSRVVRLKTYYGSTHWVEDIIKSNGFPLEIGGKKFVFLFPEVSVWSFILFGVLVMNKSLRHANGLDL
jgi:hypothetical protein